MIADDMTWKEIKRKVGEMASMENDLRQAQGAREHWKAKCERMERGLSKRYVKLPADANGEAIQFRHVVMHDGWAWRVRTLMMGDDGWLLDCVRSDAAAVKTLRPEDCTLAKWRTVEDVLREFTDAILEWAGKSGSVAEVGTWSDVAAEYAAEIRRMLDD